MTVYLAMGSAAEERMSSIAHAMINSSSVIPSSERNVLRWTLLRPGPRFEMFGNIARIIRLRLDLQRRLTGYHGINFCCESFAFACTIDRFDDPGASALTTIPIKVHVPPTP